VHGSWALGTAFSEVLASPAVGLVQTMFTKSLLFRLKVVVRDRQQEFISYFQGEAELCLVHCSTKHFIRIVSGIFKPPISTDGTPR
jgi:hypothetical protein